MIAESYIDCMKSRKLPIQIPARRARGKCGGYTPWKTLPTAVAFLVKQRLRGFARVSKRVVMPLRLGFGATRQEECSSRYTLRASRYLLVML